MESLKVGSRKKPAYIKIKEIIREQIFSSHGKAHFLSESQIIGDFRVSATTARKVLDELQNEGLVERKVGKGSFVIPFSEREIKDLGIIFFNIYDPSEPFISEVARGIEEKAMDKKYHLHLLTTRNKPISQNHQSALFHLISKRKIDGLFLLSPIPASDLIFLQKEKIPFVVVGNNYLDMEVSTVLFNHKKTIKEICKRLLKLGYKKIGLITGPKEKNGIQRSGNFIFSGYQEFLKQNNLLYDKRLFKEKEYSEEQGYQSMEELYLLPQNDRPDVIIIASSLVGTGRGALRFVEKKKDWQPFIILYTDEEINYPCYILTPCEEMGRIAFRLLEKHLEDYVAKAEKIFVPLKIIFPKNKGEEVR